MDDPAADSVPGKVRMLADWFFRDRQTGGITVVQAPNPPLWVFLATVALRWVVPDGSTLRSAIGWIGLAALGWWALDEVIRGVNPWRRMLGVGGCALVVVGVMTRLG